MRVAVGVLGDARSTGDALSWSTSPAAGRSVHAIVEPAGEGKLTVRADENLRPLRGAIVSTSLAGMMLVLVAVLAFFPHVAPFALAGWLIASYVVARARYGMRFETREAELRALVDDVAALASVGPTRVAPGIEEHAGQRVAEEADADEEMAEGDRPESARRGRR